MKLELSDELRLARERCGKTPGDVVATGICSQPKLWRLEHGVGPWKVSDMTALGFLYDVPTLHRALWEEMARATKSDDTSWAEGANAASPARFGLYLRMERRATRLKVVTLDLVHGLVQTEEHHRAMLDAWPMDSPAAEDEAVRSRQERQAAFWDRKDVSLELVMSEVALRHQIGTPAVVDRQVNRLRELAGRPGVSVLIIPIDCPPHGGMSGPFTLIETPQGGCSYVEHINGGQLLSDPEIVKRFDNAATQAAAVAQDIREWQ
ncbi:helix-turn-helix transcriptional regulator [Kineosporia sp. NBRC 101677]|uniref:helix-turn-helix domain-containing protein n=1 Tax=Kineosporia sp. NBRC 101677 TaxID=3032197 RepID=UPI0025556FF4|nr:helix-turn-helix transcriptional regulator [Kineosporia sp. NBRC 101677]